MKAITFQFRSSSSEGKIYETIRWLDDKVTCNCPGWTRRKMPDGNRVCVHTRLVLTGNPMADPLWVGMIDHREIPPDMLYCNECRLVHPTNDFRCSKTTATYNNIVDAAQKSGGEDLRFCSICKVYHWPEYKACKGVPYYPTQQYKKPAATAVTRAFDFDE